MFDLHVGRYVCEVGLVGLPGDLAELGREATLGLRHLPASPRAPAQVLCLATGLHRERHCVLLRDGSQGALGDRAHCHQLLGDLGVAASGATALAARDVVQDAASRDRVARQSDLSGGLVELVPVRTLAVGLPAFAVAVAPVEASLVRGVQHGTGGLALPVQEDRHIVGSLLGERRLVVGEQPAELDLFDGRACRLEVLDGFQCDGVIVAGEACDADHLGAQHHLGLGQREFLGLLLAAEDVEARPLISSLLVLVLFGHGRPPSAVTRPFLGAIGSGCCRFVPRLGISGGAGKNNLIEITFYWRFKPKCERANIT